MTGTTSVILGGGVGGLVTANELRKRLGKEHRVVLVDRESRHIFWPSLLWLQVGLREPGKIVRDLALLEKKGIEVIKGQVDRIDAERKVVHIDGVELAADYLVVSLGAQLAPENVPGLADAGYNLYTLEGATAIRDARKKLDSGSIVVLTAGLPYKCPAAPYEAAMLLEHDLRKRKLRDRAGVSVYAAEPMPMGVTGPDLAAGVTQMLADRDIAYFPQHQVTSVDASSGTLHFANGVDAHFDLLVYIPPHVAPEVVRQAGLTGESGWVPVDRHTLETSFPGVYAIGDVTGIPLTMGMPLPKAGVFAHHEGEAVAQTIASHVTGRGDSGRFDGGGECFIEVGGGKAGLGRGNFYAEPTPAIKLRKPTRYWHIGKVLFERDWFRRWF
jgi:sulfide:quinone oxidoreductase